jgi:trehalose 6-phosphate synthase/phosphatase
MLEPELGRRKARELRFQMVEALANLPLEVTTGKRVVEVRRSGVSKAAAVHSLQALWGKRPVYVAIGDDETDEEMFRALPSSSFTVRVGGPSPGSRYFLPDVASVRNYLQEIVSQQNAQGLRSIP